MILPMLLGRADEGEGSHHEFEMTGGFVNGTCTKERAVHNGPAFFQNGNLVFEAHDVGWIVSGLFTVAATITSFWLIGKHLRWYTNKREQRYIVRLLFMVPIYAWVSFASFLFWNNATPLILLRDMYESTVLTSFFYLLLVYLSPEPTGQRDIICREGLSKENDADMRRKGQPLQKWCMPFGSVKWKPVDGLYFLQLMKWGVLQYCVLRPLTTLAAVALDYLGLYCEASYSPAWGHVYIVLIVSISVTIAMYCLLQLYFTVAERLKPRQPLLKLFAVKAVVFLTFWQATGLGLLITFKLIKDTKYMTAEDINTGIGAILETFEMMVFSFVHVKAFSYHPYRPAVENGVEPTPTPKFRALMHAMDFRETFREIWQGTIYMWRRMRGKEDEGDRLARRHAQLEVVMGRERTIHPRPTQWPHQQQAQSRGHLDTEVDVHEEIYDDVGERQWLGIGDSHRTRREKSEALGEQIEQELKKKGYSMRRDPTIHEGHSSWWKRAFDRFSQTGSEAGPAYTEAGPSSRQRRRLSRREKGMRDSKAPLITTYEYDDPPPPSIIRNHASHRHADSVPTQQPVWSGPIQPRGRRQLASAASPHSPDSAFPMAVLSGYPDSMLGRVFLMSEEGHGSSRPLSLISSEEPAPRTSTPVRERRWTFGSDGALNGMAPPASPRSSHESNFHTAQSSFTSLSVDGSRRQSFAGTRLSSPTSSSNVEEFGYRSRSRQAPAEHSLPPSQPSLPSQFSPSHGHRSSLDVLPPRQSSVEHVPLSPPRAVGNRSRSTAHSPPAIATPLRSPLATSASPPSRYTPRHTPRNIVLPSLLADQSQSPHLSTPRSPPSQTNPFGSPSGLYPPASTSPQQYTRPFTRRPR